MPIAALRLCVKLQRQAAKTEENYHSKGSQFPDIVTLRVNKRFFAS
jgi:hypothetical protein